MLTSLSVTYADSFSNYSIVSDAAFHRWNATEEVSGLFDIETTDPYSHYSLRLANPLARRHVENIYDERSFVQSLPARFELHAITGDRRRRLPDQAAKRAAFHGRCVPFCTVHGDAD